MHGRADAALGGSLTLLTAFVFALALTVASGACANNTTTTNDTIHITADEQWHAYDITVLSLFLLIYKRRGSLSRAAIMLTVFATCVPLLLLDIALVLADVMLSLTLDFLRGVTSAPVRVYTAFMGKSEPGNWLRRRLHARLSFLSHRRGNAREPPDLLLDMLEPDSISNNAALHGGAETALPAAARRKRTNQKSPAPCALIDSGCTAHMFQRMSSVTRWIARTSTTIRGVASSLPSVGIGVVFGLTGLIVPSMQREILLSVARLCDTVPGGQMLFTATHVYAGRFTPVSVHATGTRSGNLYHMDPRHLAPKIRHPDPPPEHCLNLTHDALPTNRARLWHWRMGHLAYPRLKELRDKHLVSGIDFTDQEWRDAQTKLCPGCAAGACAKKPTHAVTHGKTGLPLGPAQQIHVD